MKSSDVAHGRALWRLVRSRVAGVLRPGREYARSGKPRIHADGLSLSPDRARRYLLATHPGGVPLSAPNILPPAASSIWETATFLDILRQAGLPVPMRGLIHLGNRRRYVRRTRPDEIHSLVVSLEASRSVRSGTILTIASTLFNHLGQPAIENSTDLLFVGLDPDGRTREATAEDSDDELGPADGFTLLASWQLDGSAGRRYAAASGDYNPIHLSRLTSIPFGFRRPILHGFCIEAMVSNLLIGEQRERAQDRLSTLDIKFSEPLLLPATATLWVEGVIGGKQRFRVESRGRSDGKVHATGAFLATGLTETGQGKSM